MVDDKQLEEREELFEMANLTKKGTGLPVNLWIVGGGFERKVTYNSYRIIMQNGYEDKALPKEMIPISIDKINPILLVDEGLKIKVSDFKLVQQFIKDHFEDFELFIKGKIDEDDLKEKVYLKEMIQMNENKTNINWLITI